MLSKKQQLLKVETDIKKHFNKVSHFRWCLSTIIHSLLVSGLLNYNGGGSHVTNQTPNAGIYATDGFIVVPPGLDRFVKAWRFTFGWKEPPKFHLQDRFKGVTHVTPFKNANIYIYISLLSLYLCVSVYIFLNVLRCTMYIHVLCMYVNFGQPRSVDMSVPSAFLPCLLVWTWTTSYASLSSRNIQRDKLGKIWK